MTHSSVLQSSDMPMTSKNRNIILLFAGTIIARIIFFILTGFTADDAFITFRYASNIVSGLGFVYNAGEAVLGTTTPLFTMLMTVPIALGISPVAGALAISLIASGLTATIIYRFALQLRLGSFAPIPAIAYMLMPRSLVADSSGMETALFTLFIIAAFYLQFRRLDYYAIGMATLATLTRPEGGLLLIILLVVNTFENRSRILSYLIGPAILLGSWILFATWYFGSPIPNSIPAKIALYSQFGIEPFPKNLILALGWHNPLGPILTLASIPGFLWLRKTQNFGRTQLIWLIGMFLFFGLSKTVLFFWYIPPTYPIYLLLASSSIVWLHDLCKQRGWKPEMISRAKSATIVGLFVAIVLIGANIPKVSAFKQFAEGMRDIHYQAGIYLSVHADKDDIVTAEDIGYLGFYSERHIVDRDGLVSPEVIPYNREGRYLDLILDIDADWVCAFVKSPISTFVDAPEFNKRYKTVHTYYPGTAAELRIYNRQTAQTNNSAPKESKK